MFGGDGTNCSVKTTSRAYKKRKQSPFLKIFLRHSQSGTPEPERKKGKLIPFMAYSCRLPIGRYKWHKIRSLSLFIHFQSTVSQHDFLSLQRRYWMVSRFWTRLSSSSMEWLVHGTTTCSLGNPLADWSLLLSQRQEILSNHLTRVPNNPNQEVTLEMRDEVLSSVGAQDMDTSGFQVSDLKDVECHWENDHLDVGAIFRPGVDTVLSHSNFNVSDIRSMDENAILIEIKHDKEKAPPLPTTPISERPTQPLELMRSRPLETRTENITEYV